jgi:hypothetical protein
VRAQAGVGPSPPHTVTIPIGRVGLRGMCQEGRRPAVVAMRGVCNVCARRDPEGFGETEIEKGHVLSIGQAGQAQGHIGGAYVAVHVADAVENG